MMSIEYAESQIIYLRRLLKLTVTPATVSFSPKFRFFTNTFRRSYSRNESSGFCFHMKWPFCANSFFGCASHRDPSLIELTQINTHIEKKKWMKEWMISHSTLPLPQINTINSEKNSWSDLLLSGNLSS